MATDKKAEKEEDAIDIEVHENEYVLSPQATKALGANFLDYLNSTLRDDPSADPLEVLVMGLKHLSDDKPTKENKSGYSVDTKTVEALGEKFLGVLDEYLKLRPDAVQEALGAATKNLPNKKKFYRGGRIIGRDPINL